MEQDDFKKQIDELFRLFNKLMEQHPMDEVPGINKFQLEQMKMFLRNYETLKDQLSYEMMGQMNEPMRQMISLFIRQLKQELGEPEDFNEPETIHVKPVKNLEEIDERLRQPGLSEEEIDRLLDERAWLQSQQNQIKIDPNKQ